jgi:hypothetical protein
MASIERLLSEPQSADWSRKTSDFFLGLTEEQLHDETFCAQLRQLVELIKTSYDESFMSRAHDAESSLEDAQLLLRAAEQAIALLSAPVPKTPVKTVPKLPSPLTALTRVGILGIYEKEPKPTSHGCGFFEGAPWDMCYACEYEKDPANYARKMRHADLIQLIGASFRDVRKGNLADSWSNETMESVMYFLDTPRAERCYTDAQVADLSFQDGTTLLASLRALMRPM